MSTLTTRFERETSWSDMWQRVAGTHRLLALSVMVYLVLFAGTIVLSILDSRLVVGAPVWFKPMKFAISSALYSATLLWMLGFVEGRRRWVLVIGTLTVVGFVVELVAIFLQAARGLPSHFNVATPFDATLFSLMGTFVVVIWVMNIGAAVLLMRQRLPDRPLAWALRLGLLITIIGAAAGFLMTQPTPAQAEAIAAGTMPAIIGAHSVGVVDGGPGLPFLGWSTAGGDLRPAHFVGLHALQFLPLVALVLNRRRRDTLSANRRAALVAIAGAGYLGLVAILVWQALRAQPLIAPDALTLAALGGLAAAVVVAALVVVRRR